MTRGRPATTGIKGAAVVARARGEFIPFSHSPEGIFSFMIRTPGAMIFVRVQYVNVLHVPVAKIQEEHRDLIPELRARSGLAPAELWPYNKHGSYRYFRVTDAGLVELDSSGNVPAAGRPGDRTGPEETGGSKEGVA